MWFGAGVPTGLARPGSTGCATTQMGGLGRPAGLLDLDFDRLRLWVFARCVQKAIDDPVLADVTGRVAPI